MGRKKKDRKSSASAEAAGKRDGAASSQPAAPQSTDTTEVSSRKKEASSPSKSTPLVTPSSPSRAVEGLNSPPAATSPGRKEPSSPASASPSKKLASPTKNATSPIRTSSPKPKSPRKEGVSTSPSAKPSTPSPKHAIEAESKRTHASSKSPIRKLSRRKSSVGEDASGEIVFDVPSPDETKAVVEHTLERRKSIQELKDAGILVAQSAEEVEEQAQQKQELAEVVEKFIGERPPPEEMEKVAPHVVDPGRRASGNLAATAVELERHMTMDKMKKHLDRRPSKEELQQQGVIPELHSAPAIQEVQLKLDHELKKNQVSHLLESRPNKEELEGAGIIDGHVAPSLQPIKHKLERELTKDRVEHLLEHRPTLEELVSQHILTPEHSVATSIQGAQAELQKNLVRSGLNRRFSNRRSLEDLTEEGLLGAPLASGSQDEFSSLVVEGRAIPLEPLPAHDPQPVRLSSRYHIAIALKGTAKLYREGVITLEQRSALKELIFKQDARIITAIQAFAVNHNAQEMLDKLYLLAARLIPAQRGFRPTS